MNSGRELVHRNGLSERAAEADLGEGLRGVDPERSSEQRVVPDLGMRVECQVIRGQRDLCFQEHL